DQLLPGNPLYNESNASRLRFLLNVPALKWSLNEILRRHEALRTTFHASPRGPVQLVSAAHELNLPVTDLGHLPRAEREAEALRLAQEEGRRPFDLTHGPLVRAELLRLGPDDHVFVLTMHHIVCDGWSMGVFFRELKDLYTAFCAGRPSPLPELPVQ